MPTPIFDHTPIDFEADNYEVYRVAKGERMANNTGEPIFTGTFDDCDEYADRNDSPDNPDRYVVMQAS